MSEDLVDPAIELARSSPAWRWVCSTRQVYYRPGRLAPPVRPELRIPGIIYADDLARIVERGWLVEVTVPGEAATFEITPEGRAAVRKVPRHLVERQDVNLSWVV